MRASDTRIVILADAAQVGGGAAQVAITAACGLARRGWRVIYVHADDSADAGLAAAGVELWRVPTTPVWQEHSRPSAAARAVWNRAAFATVTACIGRGDPERTIVHAHQWTKALSPAALAAATRAGAPLMVTLHDYFASCPNGLFFDFKAEAACTRTPLGPACLTAACDRDGRLHKAVRLARQLAINAAVARADTLVHVSETARARVRPYLPASARHVVLANPCAVEPGPPVDVAGNEALVLIGRLTIEKGLHPLLAAWRGSGRPLVVLGDGPLAPELRAHGGPLTLLPWGDAEAVRAVLDQARALAFPSLWAETAGLVAAEALARGVPVLASAGTGAAALIARTGGGIVAPPGDVAAWRHALRRIEDDDLVRALGRAAHAGYWAAPMSVAEHVAGLERLYTRLLRGRPALPSRRPDDRLAGAGMAAA